ncbi:MAG: hypothetical protein O3C40_13165 [Planctomycetota bacterium]|nr:hypothetical protein [Planctomycetota bacterium]
MTNRWRMLPAETPGLTVPALWCLTVFSVIVVGTGVVGLSVEFPRAARETELCLSVLICMVVPILAVSSWGLVFRRFAFGSAWIAVTLVAAGSMCGAMAAVVAADARGKDSIGHGLVIIFGTPILFGSVLVASSVAYAVWWRKRNIVSAAIREPRNRSPALEADVSEKTGDKQC